MRSDLFVGRILGNPFLKGKIEEPLSKLWGMRSLFQSSS